MKYVCSTSLNRAEAKPKLKHAQAKLGPCRGMLKHVHNAMRKKPRPGQSHVQDNVRKKPRPGQSHVQDNVRKKPRPGQSHVQDNEAKRRPKLKHVSSRICKKPKSTRNMWQSHAQESQTKWGPCQGQD